MKDLRAKVAVITGAASGIGSGLAEEAARRGMRLVLADVDENGLSNLAARIEAQGADVRTLRCDVSDPAQVDALAELAFSTFGGVHLLFNNAGVTTTGRVWEADLKDWQWLFGVNVWGVVNGIKSFVPRMLAEGEPGYVVNTSSLAGFLNLPYNGIYGATKHAVIAISEVLNFELQAANAKLKAAVICPGPVATNIMEAEKHRPSTLSGGAQTAEAKAFLEAMKAGTASVGMPPEAMADIVFTALAEGRFWILPHREMLLEPLQQKIKTLAAGEVPVYQPLGEMD